jgi:hypothetical protein
VSRPFALRAGATARLRFAVGRPVMAHAIATRVLRLRLMVASATEPFALRGRYRVDAWRP